MRAEVAVVGSFVQDLAFRVPQFVKPGETRIGEFFSGPGGKGSNQAVACHRQNVPTLFIGAVGDDIFGDGYRAWSKEEGMQTALLSLSTHATGAASIVVNSQAENQIIVALGANDALTPEHVIRSLRAEPNLKVVLTQAENNLAATRAALEYARESGIFSIFNPAPINDGVSLELLKIADCITPNETECQFLLERLTGQTFSLDTASLCDGDVASIAQHLGVSRLIITLGSAGSVFCQNGDVRRFSALPVNPIDTTGAGDAFNGGLAAGFVRFESDMPQAIRYATVVAALSTERAGTAPAMPSQSQVSVHSNFYSN